LTESSGPATRRELREFGLIVGGIVGGLFGVVLPLLKHRPFPVWPWVVLVVLASPALLWPSALRPLHFLWIRLGQVLGWMNQRVVLTILFYVILTPTGLLMRLFGRDPIARRFDSAATSYRTASREPSPRDMERPF
jgi:hypothetical protein